MEIGRVQQYGFVRDTFEKVLLSAEENPEVYE